MRVLLCTPAYKPALDFGGPVTKIGLLAPALQELGVDVEILTADFGDGRTKVAPGRRDIDGVPVTYLRRVASRGYLSVSPGAARVVREFDVVHLFGLRDGLVNGAAAFAARRRRIPAVLEPMGMAVPRIRSVGLKRAFDRVTGAVTAAPTITIATSELEAMELRELGYSNVVVRTNPVDLPTLVGRRPRPLYDICYVGRLHTKKRLTDVVAALASNQSWTAVVAGPDEDGSAEVLRRAASTEGVSERLTIRGWIDATERQTLIRSSRCFVLPSATENFGNAAAEAIALGTPAVVTDQCGVATLVRETDGGVVTRVATADVVRAVSELLAPGRRSMRSDVLTRYSPAAVAREQLSIYESVLA